MFVGPATSQLSASVLFKLSVALASAAGVSPASATLNVIKSDPYSFQLHFSFPSDNHYASVAQSKVASAIGNGALPEIAGAQNCWGKNKHLYLPGAYGQITECPL